MKSDEGILGLRERVAAGAERVEEVAEKVVARIAERDGEVRAWKDFDPAYVHRQAETVSRHRRSGRPLGPLHGVPVGIKDIIDVAGLPTGLGLKDDASAPVMHDSTLVGRLREAGAVIVGKTVTTELAYFEPRETRNPHDLSRTPGGSSSGSAAAVADGHVPIAIGTQTNGSMIRPASFCGIVGYKPSHGMLARTGILLHHEILDTPGIYAQSVPEAALVGEVVAGADGRDRSVAWEPRGGLLETALGEPPVRPIFAIVRGPYWDQADEAVKAAFDELADVLGDQADVIDLPSPFAHAASALEKIMKIGFAHNLPAVLARRGATPGEIMREAMEVGRTATASSYLEALAIRDILRAGLAEIFERYAAILTPAAPGEAPEGLGSTGNPIFCSTWQLTGNPAVSLPVMTGENGLPVGLQVVGAYNDDARLLRTAHWLHRHLRETE